MKTRKHRVETTEAEMWRYMKKYVI